MKVVSLDPLSDARWLTLLEAPGAGLFHSRPWLGTIADAYGFAIRALVALDPSGVPMAGIPYCELDDLRGRRIVSLPFTDACDPLGESPPALAALRTGLESMGAPLQLRELDASPGAAGAGWEVSKRARWHRLALDDGIDKIRLAMGPAMRRGIRKAEREGVVVRPVEDDEGLRAFVAMHAALRRRRYRLLAQPPAFFEAMRSRFGAGIGWHPLGAYLDDRLVAVTVYLHWRGRLYYKFNASSPDALAMRPNNLLVWSGIQLALALGCSTLDLGPSDDDQPGLVRFKRDTGAAESELRHLRWLPPGPADPRAVEAQGVLRELTGLLTAPGVPDDVVRDAGALLYRYFA